MQNLHFLFFTVFLIISHCSVGILIISSTAYSQTLLSSEQEKISNELSPEKGTILKTGFNKNNNVLTPNAANPLMGHPGFADITPGEINAGKKILDNTLFFRKPDNKEIIVTKGAESLFSRFSAAESYSNISPVSMRYGYDFLKTYSKSLLVGLETLKEIQVFVLGEVQNPGTYTFDSLPTIASAIIAAGGPTRTGSLRNIQLMREGEDIIKIDFYNFILEYDKFRYKILQSGDVIVIPTSVILVGIAGNVKRPAIYELKDKYDLMSLLDMAGVVMPSPYTQQIKVERIQKNKEQTIINIDDKHLDKVKDFILQDGDLVKVFPIVDRSENVVFLKGHVKHPGKYEYKSGMRVKDLIKDTKDLLKDPYLKYALIKRFKPPIFEKELISFNLGSLLLENDNDSNIKLESQDSLYIFPQIFFKNVTIEGEVKKTGTLEILGNSNVKDAILEAGGLKVSAYLQKGEIIRTSEQDGAEHIYFNVGLAMAENPENNILLYNKDKIIIHSINTYSYDLSLEPSDEAVVKRKPERQDKKYITISGEVNSPGKYLVRKGERLAELIGRAGGYTDKAYLRGTVFINEEVRKKQQKSLDYIIAKLEGILLTNESVRASTALSKEEIEVKKVELEQKQKFIDSLKKLKATGRIPVKLDHLRLLKGSEYDIELDNGDSIFIPMKESFVNVSGAVVLPGSFVYSEKFNYKNYIKKAGGYTKYADKDNVFVLKVDGTIRKLSRSFIAWNFQNERWELMAFNKETNDIVPGDTIVVPEKLDRIAWLREIKDITQIHMQTAVIAGVVVNLF